jgi:hypothetical protein
MAPNVELENRLRLSREQSEAYNVLTRPEHGSVTRVIYGGQAGGGKSFLICLWLDQMASLYPGTRYYMAREHLKDIKESVLLTFWDVLKITGSKVHYNGMSNVITYENGSSIYLVEVFAYPSDPNFDALGSREYTGGAIEEGITVTRRAADILLSRTRYKHDEFNLFPKQLITCNPGDGWIKEEIVIPTIEGRSIKANNLFIRATLESNPNRRFRELYAKTLEENLTEFDRARLLHGDWNAKPMTGSEFLKNWRPEKHVLPTKYNPDLPLHVAFDENVNPYITCLLFQIQKEKLTRWITQIGEICQKPPINTRKHVCDELLRRYPTHTAGMFIYGDASSWKNETGKEFGENFFTDIMSYLRRFHPSLRVPKKNPPVMSKGGFMNLLLEKRYRNLAIRIDPSCRHSIVDYAHSLEDSDGGILKTRVKDPFTGISYEKFGHHVDAFSYFVTEAFLSDFDYYLSGDWKPSYEVGSDRHYRFHR